MVHKSRGNDRNRNVILPASDNRYGVSLYSNMLLQYTKLWFLKNHMFIEVTLLQFVQLRHIIKLDLHVRFRSLL